MSSVVYFDQTNEPSAESLDIQKVFIWTPKKTPTKNTHKLSFGIRPRCLGLAVFVAHVSFGEAKTTNGSLSQASSSNEAQLAQLLLAAATGDGRVGATLWGSYPGGVETWSLGETDLLPLVLCFFNSTLEGKLKLMGFQKLFACVGCWSWWWRRWGLNH